MNQLLFVGNIVAQIRNLFSPLTGVVASVAEDGFSVKLNSSKFVSQEEVNKILYDTNIMRGTCLASYIQQQGLSVMKMINVGQYFVVYFCPNDIKGAGKTDEVPANMPCKEMQELDIEETEMYSLIKESDDDEEIKDITREKISELVASKDKVKAAKQLELLLTQELELPREYYFAGVKSKDGDESIALRWKYTKKMPFGKAEGDGEYKETTVENTRSLMHIFGKGEKAIWVQDFDEDSLVELPEEVKKLIQSILDLLEAGETDNPSVFSLTGERKERKDDEGNEDDDNKDDDKGSKSDDDDDSEDDDSRGDDTL